MTDARSVWVRAQDRKRTLSSWGIAALLYLVAFAGWWATGLFAVEDMAEFSGPIVVRLGSPEGVDAPRPVPDTVPPTPEPVVQPPETPPVETPPEPVPMPVPDTAPKAPVPAPPVSKPAPTPTTPRPATPAPPQPPAPAPVVIRGTDSGNSYDMTFDGAAGAVGRSFYEPIWLYLPLPYEIGAALYDAVPDKAGLAGTAETRRAAIAAVYETSPSGSWRLRRGMQPGYESRPEIWSALVDAGYDVEKADYKDGKNLRPVVILFKVSAYSAERGVILEDLAIEGAGSGYSDIDDAVVYGFRKAQFSNSSPASVRGRYTYRF